MRLPCYDLPRLQMFAENGGDGRFVRTPAHRFRSMFLLILLLNPALFEVKGVKFSSNFVLASGVAL